MRKLRRGAADALPSMLAGAFSALAMRVAGEGGGRLALLLFGALYGLAVLGLLRLFRAPGFGLVVAGLFCGPVPAALLVQEPLKAEDRGGAWVGLALFGALLGALEWARARAARRAARDPA